MNHVFHSCQSFSIIPPGITQFRIVFRLFMFLYFIRNLWSAHGRRITTVNLKYWSSEIDITLVDRIITCLKSLIFMHFYMLTVMNLYRVKLRLIKNLLRSDMRKQKQIHDLSLLLISH